MTVEEAKEYAKTMSDEERLDLIGCGVNIGSRWSKQNTIAEIEKIKAEILNFIGGMNMCNDLDNEAFKKLDIRIDGIFDEHISELKGENNA